ncbi:MAG: hypothetical protein HUJ56_11095 [Erysipelotrichaceae bacterium]|nr:hypothetical protein [Erysipelotrichaceae bacterium]
MTEDGQMIIAKIEGNAVTDANQLKPYLSSKLDGFELHPMLVKYNRLDYLMSQQYSLSVVGSHVFHKTKLKAEKLL